MMYYPSKPCHVHLYWIPILKSLLGVHPFLYTNIFIPIADNLISLHFIVEYRTIRET